ncbi:protein SABRE-like isoform X1 [Vicia villosa]|uniref:protein SABRE-like isoform X1 n=3 Tax=Vicia villosa TaxID=3911 RepID=UPI00273BED84|nr:protein SABRE-like isoform X1 [Vicia villosa]
MAASAANFLSIFFLFCVALFLIFTFSSALLSWILSRILGASVEFCVGGCNSLRDVTVKFVKGATESVSIGEIKLSLLYSSVEPGVGFRSWNPKLQLSICNLEVVMRPTSTNKSSGKKKTKKSKTRSLGKGKWKTIVNIARYLSFSLTELVLKTPKGTVGIGKVNVDISKVGGPESKLFVSLHILPIVVHIGDPQVSYDQLSKFSVGGCSVSSQASAAPAEKPSAPFICEKFSVSCEFGHHREVGIVIKNVDVSIGEVTVNLNERLLIKKKRSSESSSGSDRSSVDPMSTKQSSTKQEKLARFSSLFPEKVAFNLPKLNVSFEHSEHGLSVENNISGIKFTSIKSRSNKDIGESTRFHFQLEFREIHLLKEASASVLEITKVHLVSFVYVPVQSTSLARAETEIKLGRSQCNIIMSRLKPWLRLHSSKKKKVVLREEASVVKPKSNESKTITWTCKFSTPEITIVLYNMAGFPVYHGCLQSPHLFANNISNMGTSVHIELGEFNLQLADENKEWLKESIFGVESDSGSIMQITKVSLDWGKKDMKSSEEDGAMSMLGLSIDVTSMGIYLTIKRLETLISTAISVQALMKSLSSKKKSTQSRARSSKSSGKGTQILKCNLVQCSVYVLGETGLENTDVLDPKRVNYGSQGGRVIIDVSEDGTPRSAKIVSTVSANCQKLKYCISLEVVQTKLCINKMKQSTQIELERARSIYKEYVEESMPMTKVALFDIQNTKFVKRLGGLKEKAACSLFSATGITIRWEPDVHLSLIELVLQLKLVVHNKKLEEYGNECMGDSSKVKDANCKNEATMESRNLEKKKGSIFAVDVEMLNISAELGDGVDAMVQVHSIFSENASIGVLFEELLINFNQARILKSSRMQISRIPSISASASDAKGSVTTTWDWVIQGLDVQICLPFRLELRAIDDVLEDMLRALKLIVAAKTNLIFPVKKDNSKVKKPSSTKFGCIKFFLRKLTADIEEESIQGWLDEHYQMLKKEVGELVVRLDFLDEFVSKAKQDPNTSDDLNNSSQEGKIYFNDVEVDVNDSSIIESMREDIYKRSFRSYYEACQKLVLSEGSGACKDGFQAGFKPSASRSSLFTISVLDLDVSLTKIDGGDDGMIEFLRKLDPVCLECDIPFSRLYGANILLNAGSLVAQIRNYTFPLFSGNSGKCKGCLVLAQQATSFQPQILQDVYVGRWRKVCLLRSASGTTPPMKTFLDLPLHFQRGEVSFGVGYEPVFADLSYAFTVVLRRANLSIRNPGPLILPPKKEKSLPWWDDMRNYIHGKISLLFSETRWYILASTDPYEKHDNLQIVTSSLEIHQSDGRIFVFSKDFKIFLSSLESLANKRGSKIPDHVNSPFLEAPTLTTEVTMDWGCDSGQPLNHYLFALPVEGKTREIIFDPFRSTSLSIRWTLSFGSVLPLSEKKHPSSIAVNSTEADANVSHPTNICQNVSPVSPTIKLGAHDLAWIVRFWNLNYLPPHKLRMFSRWPRFGVPRIIRSGNLSLDKVMTEFMMRIDSTPICIKNMPLHDDDPAKGLTFMMTKLKLELYFSRGQEHYTFECKRELLDLVYQSIDLHRPKCFLNKEECGALAKSVNVPKSSQSASEEKTPSEKGYLAQKNHDDGFLLSCDYFTIRKQSPKADPATLLAWQEAGRRNVEKTYVQSNCEKQSETDDHMQSDPSDDDEYNVVIEDDGYNVVIADNCRRVFVYGLKLLWNIENRNAVCFWAGGLAKAAAPAKPSPSRQYAQRKLHENNNQQDGTETRQEDACETHEKDETEMQRDDGAETHKDEEVETHKDEGVETHQDEVGKSLPTGNNLDSPSSLAARTSEFPSFPSSSLKMDSLPSAKYENTDEEGTRHFMVNVIEPQFNLHSEGANGRFLLAAVSGRVLAQSFHSILHVGHDMIEQARGTTDENISEYQPEIAWKRMELSVMLEHVQAHVAPTDVDLGAGVQWLPKIIKGSPKVMRTGALLERVFMPCDMYFQYTRHKGGTPEVKVKPLKELKFNSHNITAAMTSRQFQVMLDVLNNLLLARLPKPPKSSLTLPNEDDENVEEEADEVVPDGIEEVELAKINLEKKEREQELLLNDIKKLSFLCDPSQDQHPEKEPDLWMIDGGIAMLVQGLKRELVSAKKSRKEAYASLRMAMQKAAQARLMEKEKNKSPSHAMRIFLQINKVVWSMLLDGKSFAEAEINDMIYEFDRDYKDVGVSQFTTKYLVFKNCLPNAKSDTILSAWNPPAEWGKKVMLRVDARQGAPKDGSSPFELFQVEIYPLKIHLQETMYRMMWGYFFPEEDRVSQRRQEVWKVSTTAGARRVKKGSSASEASTSSNQSTKESEASSKSSISSFLFPTTNQSSAQASKAQNVKVVPGSTPELKKSSSFDKSWEETVAESVADELVLQSLAANKNGPFDSTEQQDEASKSKSKDPKGVKAGQSSIEEKKVAKPQKIMEFHNIKISQVELCVTYEGQRFVVNDMKLLMDQFHRAEFTGTWRRLFSRVKKHIIWGVLKSVTGMQGKKFKDKGQNLPSGTIVPEIDLHVSDTEGHAGKTDKLPPSWPKRPTDGAGDGFVTSVKGLFNTQRRKAKAFVLKTMKNEAENEAQGDWSENEAETSHFARTLTIVKAKKLIKRHTQKYSKEPKGSAATAAIPKEELQSSSPKEEAIYDSDSSSGSSSYEAFLE